LKRKNRKITSGVGGNMIAPEVVAPAAATANSKTHLK